jgi:DNA N-6-adenine-methyltransferase (Dam)
MKGFKPWAGMGKDDKPADNQPTPTELYQSLDAEFHFDYDPCPINPEGLREKDGLGSSWGQANYVNPPYSHKEHWIERAIAEQRRGRLTVMLFTCRYLDSMVSRSRSSKLRDSMDSWASPVPRRESASAVRVNDLYL